MKNRIECPYCDGHAVLSKSNRDIPYRKESFNVVEHYYVCEECREEFTTTDTDTITITQLHNQYRERHKLPFPEEIMAIREKYGLSAAKMSEVLGLGANGYGNYERGEMPTAAIGNLIYAGSNPEYFKTLLKNAREHFTERPFQEVLKKVDFLIERERSERASLVRLNLYDRPNSFTGYRQPNRDKIANLLVGFISSCIDKYNDRLKLNKMFFYTDFLCYKHTGSSLTGLTYRAIQYGPVPACYDNIYAQFEYDGTISPNFLKTNDGSAREVFTTEGELDKCALSKVEADIFDMVIYFFKDTPTWEMVENSHKEKAWIELHNEKQAINYQTYAFDLTL